MDELFDWLSAFGLRMPIFNAPSHVIINILELVLTISHSLILNVTKTIHLTSIWNIIIKISYAVYYISYLHYTSVAMHLG